MLSLGLETSGTLCSVAFVQNKNTLLEYNIEIANIHATTMPDLVHEGLKRINRTANNLDLIAIGSGPGSFTGLRIGMAYAKGLGYALNKPVIPVTNFHILAFQAIRGMLPIYSVIDARRDNFYVGEFLKSFQDMEQARMVSRQQLKEVLGLQAQVVTPIRDFTCDAAGISVLTARYSATIVALLGEFQFEQHGADEIDQLEPLYMQKFAGVNG